MNELTVGLLHFKQLTVWLFFDETLWVIQFVQCWEQLTYMWFYEHSIPRIPFHMRHAGHCRVTLGLVFLSSIRKSEVMSSPKHVGGSSSVPR